MKSEIHPKYRDVVFQDTSSDLAFVTRSTIETTVPSAKRSSARAPTFIEVIPETPSVGHKCIVEFERPGGSKMRIHFESAGAAELSALGNLFWLGER